jgi:hypothetical protein
MARILTRNIKNTKHIGIIIRPRTKRGIRDGFFPSGIGFDGGWQAILSRDETQDMGVFKRL